MLACCNLIFYSMLLSNELWRFRYTSFYVSIGFGDGALELWMSWNGLIVLCGLGLACWSPISYTKSLRIVELVTLERSGCVDSIFRSLSRFFICATEQSSEVSLRERVGGAGFYSSLIPNSILILRYISYLVFSFLLLIDLQWNILGILMWYL